MNRRLFLKNLGLSGVGLSLASIFPLKALAQASPQECFLMIHIENGWDISLATDPWLKEQRPLETDYFLEYLISDLLPFGNSFVGPAMAPLAPYFSRMAIINGIYMNAQDNGHPALQRYAQSGNGQGGLAALPLELEGRLFTSPFGTVANKSVFNGNRSGSVWSTTSILSSGELSAVESLAPSEVQTEIEKARTSLLNNQDKISDFNDLLKTMSAGGMKLQDIHAIAAAFGSSLSQTGMLQINQSDIDSHSGHPKSHILALTQALTTIADLLKLLSSTPAPSKNGQSLLDVTTILVTSEFTRTPALNGSQGKDHNPQANSAILIGPRVRSAKVGAAELIPRQGSPLGIPYLAGLPLNLQTQEISSLKENSFIIRPENVIGTALRALRLDPQQVSSSIAKAEVLKSAIKS